MPQGYTPAEWGGVPSEVKNRSNAPLFKKVELDWAMPTLWEKGKHAPVEHNEPCVYILQREHLSSHQRMRIAYVGLTIRPKTRFLNHPTANRLVGMRGKTFLSYAVVQFTGNNAESRVKSTLEQVEHLLIWAVFESGVENDKKVFTLPGMGSKGATAWHIHNSGYGFEGQMPKEIVYPWMLVKSR